MGIEFFTMLMEQYMPVVQKIFLALAILTACKWIVIIALIYIVIRILIAKFGGPWE